MVALLGSEPPEDVRLVPVAEQRADRDLGCCRRLDRGVRYGREWAPLREDVHRIVPYEAVEKLMYDHLDSAAQAGQFRPEADA
jgi:hypothetical protein